MEENTVEDNTPDVVESSSEEKEIVVHENIHRLKIGDRNVALIGTAHVSQESADLVKEVIDKEKPDSVCVELCENRYKSIKDKESWRNTDLVKVIKEKKALILIINFMLASFQKKMAKKLGVRPGQEMIQAIESANEHELNIEVIDRDVRTTLNRTWGYMGFKSKFNLFIGMIGWPALLGGIGLSVTMFGKMFNPEVFTGQTFAICLAVCIGLIMFGSGKGEEESDELTKEKLEDMKKQDTLELLLAEMGESVPDIKKRLIDERDLYMVENIRHAPGENVVAIVGAGHVPGMIKNWETEINLSELEEAPKSGKMGVILKWGIPAIIILVFVLGFIYGGEDKFKEMAWEWILANGICSAIGTAIAFGHPVSILTAFIAAPITSLNPTIGAGMVVGFVEAKLRKPKVEDFETLQEDFTTTSGWWRNKVTRILLVFLLSGFGSGIGTWLSLYLFSQ